MRPGGAATRRLRRAQRHDTRLGLRALCFAQQPCNRNIRHIQIYCYNVETTRRDQVARVLPVVRGHNFVSLVAEDVRQQLAHGGISFDNEHVFQFALQAYTPFMFNIVQASRVPLDGTMNDER